MIQLAEYATLPVLDVRRGFALGVAMVTAIPQNAPEAVKVSGRRVHAATTALKADWATREATETANRRPADLRNDRAWSAFAGALDSAATLASTPRGQVAAELQPLLFANGLTFTQLPFEKQWAESARLLALIEGEGLEAKITRAVGGPEYLTELRASHTEYGAALNITEPAERQAEVNLSDALGKLRDSLNLHLSQLVAWGNQAPESESLARAALDPIDQARARESARATGHKPPEPEVTPESPVPPAP